MPQDLPFHAGVSRGAAPRGGVAVIGRVSVIVTTYNRPDALDAVLRALAQQTDTNFEILVADDGSRPDTARVIEGWTAAAAPPRLKHVWQPDDGFRLAEIRNRAIRAAPGEYCIFLDGDCLARADFVATHRRLAERGCFVAGNRILFSRDLDGAMLRERLTAERGHLAALGASACGGISIGCCRRFSCRLGRCADIYAPQLAWREDLQFGGLRAATSIVIDGFDA